MLNYFHSIVLATVWLLVAAEMHAQTFALQTQSDSLHVLTLLTGARLDKWRLPYPVYRFETADLNGDGVDEAVIGVVKPTRFFPQPARRVFIFKNVDGMIRPLWLGSRLGGKLIDFRIAGDCIRSLEQMSDDIYAVVEYRLGRFGLSFVRYVVERTDEETAMRAWRQ